MSETGPEARAEYLAGLGRSLDEAERMGRLRPVPEHRGIVERLADAERALAQTEADWERAATIAADARADFGPGIEHAYQRHLDPEQRHRLVVALDAEAHCRDVEEAYLEARHKVNRLLADFEAIQRPDWDLPPGRDSEPWRL